MWHSGRLASCMVPPAGSASSNGSAPKFPEFSVGPLEKKEIFDFMVLQDLFAGEHLALTERAYPSLGLRDWQLALLCPEKVLEKKGGREDHAIRMIERSDECFEGLSILRAVTEFKGKAVLAGFIMFQVHKEDKKKPRPLPGRKRRRTGPAMPWVQVMQIFVRRELRHESCGKILFDSMTGAVTLEEAKDIRLSVLDLNGRATKWYRDQGFVVIQLIRELLGKSEEANVIVYQEMQRLHPDRLGGEEMEVPSLFRSEVLQEEIRVSYPGKDGGGVFDLRVVDYDAKCRFHITDSKGLSLWQGERFFDTINLNEYFRDGHVVFKRHLSLILRDFELAKRLSREQMKEEKAELSAKRQHPEALEPELAIRKRGRAPL